MTACTLAHMYMHMYMHMHMWEYTRGCVLKGNLRQQ
jgi:hypothetical protein